MWIIPLCCELATREDRKRLASTSEKSIGREPDSGTGEGLSSNFRRSLKLAKELEDAAKDAKKKADEEAKKTREKERKGV